MSDKRMVADDLSVGKRERCFERKNVQTSRAGWRPKKTGKARLAADIAESIKAHEDRCIGDYTIDPELVALIQKALGG